jgi:xanthine dehydrogenase YagR molybdenum-binding subunit
MTTVSGVTGQPIDRIDGPLKVSGQAQYAADYHMPDLAHGAVVSARIASGRILSIDTHAALALAGVIEVFTHLNRPKAASIGLKYKDLISPPGTPFRPLHDEHVLFADQPIALVVAESYEAARDAAALITVTYEQTPFDTDLESNRHLAFEPKIPRFGIKGAPKPRGDADAAFVAAPIKIEVDYVTAPEYHNPMELFATTVEWNADGSMLVYDKTQGPQNVQLYLKLALRKRLKDIRVVNRFVGGAFGAALRPSHTVFLAALAARHLQRSIRIVFTRAQMFSQTYRPHALQHVALACDRDGRLQSIKHRALAATSNYENQQEMLVNWSGLAYACKNVKLEYQLVPLATPTPGDMRAPGAATGIFALESAMDELAYEANIDPVELRLANWIDHDQNEDLPITAKAQRECYAQAGERFGWSRRLREPRSMREGHELIGWGMAGGAWDATVAPMPTRARATWRTNGILEIAAAASDIGTGTYTILAQIAAESFGIPVDRVVVQIGDSSLPFNPVEGGSWMAASTGAAVAKACEKLKELIVSTVRKTREVKPKEKLRVVDGRIVSESTFRDGIAIEHALRDQGDISATATNFPDLIGNRKHVSYTHSAVFAEVRVDEQLGVTRVTRVVTAIAAGRILNPKTARSQILGSVVMGISKALHEEGIFDHRLGKVMNHSFADYHIPTNADIYDIDVIFVDEKDPKASPLGIKGVGEIGIVAVAPAIANAIFHATGRRVRRLPITPDKLLI